MGNGKANGLNKLSTPKEMACDEVLLSSVRVKRGGRGGARGSGRGAKGLDGRNICKYKQYSYLLEQTV